MRTEQEIREAMELCISKQLVESLSIQMEHSLKELLDGIRSDQKKPCKTNQGSESAVTE
jgi:hypothetical protein